MLVHSKVLTIEKKTDMKQKKERSSTTKKQKESETYFKTDMRSDSIEWKSILERKCKIWVMKVVGTLGVEADMETENLEQPF